MILGVVVDLPLVGVCGRREREVRDAGEAAGRAGEGDKRANKAASRG